MEWYNVIMKIIVLVGGTYLDKVVLATKLIKNSDVGYVAPYSTINYAGYIHVPEKKMLHLLNQKPPLFNNKFHDEWICFFENQLLYDYNIIIAETSDIITQIKNNFDDEVLVVNISQSNNVFENVDINFDMEYDDIHILEGMIE